MFVKIWYALKTHILITFLCVFVSISFVSASSSLEKCFNIFNIDPVARKSSHHFFDNILAKDKRFKIVRGTDENQSLYWPWIDFAYQEIVQRNKYPYPYFLVLNDLQGNPAFVMGLIETKHGVWIHKIGYKNAGTGKKLFIYSLEKLFQTEGWFLQARQKPLSVIYDLIKVPGREIYPLPLNTVERITNSIHVPSLEEVKYTIRRPSKEELSNAYQTRGIPNDPILDTFTFIRQEHRDKKIKELPVKVMVGKPFIDSNSTMYP